MELKLKIIIVIFFFHHNFIDVSGNSSSALAGIILTNTDYGIISDNIIENASNAGSGAGYRIWEESPCTNCNSIYGNWVVSSKSAEVQIDGGGSVTDNI